MADPPHFAGDETTITAWSDAALTRAAKFWRRRPLAGFVLLLVLAGQLYTLDH